MMSDPNAVVRTLVGSPYRTMDEFFARHSTKAQLFTISPNRRTTIVGARGTRFTFSPFSICDVFGKPVNGEVEIRLVEINSRREMVASNKVTTSEDKLLETAGQFMIQASQNFLPLDLLEPVEVEIPVSEKLRNAVAMRLYEGSTSTTRTFISEKAFDWKLFNNRSIKVKKIRGKKYFTFKLDKFNWFSCNYLVSRRARSTMVSAKMTQSLNDLDDQLAFLVFKDLNTVARMHHSGHKFTSFNVPLNKPVQVLIMGVKKGQLYFGRTNIDHTSNQLVPVSIQPVSELTLLDAINQV